MILTSDDNNYSIKGLCCSVSWARARTKLRKVQLRPRPRPRPALHNRVCRAAARTEVKMKAS